jgi:hypothetical protein
MLDQYAQNKIFIAQLQEPLADEAGGCGLIFCLRRATPVSYEGKRSGNIKDNISFVSDAICK